MSLGRPPAQFEAARESIRAAIAAGRFEASRLLPGEPDLATEFALSRTTVRRVIAALVEEGLLKHQQGVGTFLSRLAQPAAERPDADSVAPAVLTGFSAAMRRRGLTPSSTSIEWALVEPSPEQAVLLACSPHERVFRLRRLRCVDSEPVQVEESVGPEAFRPDAGALGGSLYEALARRNVVPVRALERFGTAHLGQKDAGALGLEPGRLAIRLQRTDYLPDGRCCLVTIAMLRPDRFDLLIERGGTADLPCRAPSGPAGPGGQD